MNASPFHRLYHIKHRRHYCFFQFAVIVRYIIFFTSISTGGLVFGITTLIIKEPTTYYFGQKWIKNYRVAIAYYPKWNDAALIIFPAVQNYFNAIKININLADCQASAYTTSKFLIQKCRNDSYTITSKSFQSIATSSFTLHMLNWLTN